jgi:hypothetical protein
MAYTAGKDRQFFNPQNLYTMEAIVNERLVICIAIAAVLVGLAVAAWAIATAENCDHEEPDIPGEDYIFSERPNYDSYKSLN